MGGLVDVGCAGRVHRAGEVWAPWWHRPPSTPRRYWPRRRRRSTRSREDGSSSAWAPGGIEPSTRRSGFPSTIASTDSRRRSPSSGLLLTDGHVDFQGPITGPGRGIGTPRPAAGIPLLIGSNGPRMLEIALPHVAMWNTWHSSFGNDSTGCLRCWRRSTGRARLRAGSRGRWRRRPRSTSNCRRRTGGSPARGPRVGQSPIPALGRTWPSSFGHFAAGLDQVQLVLDPIDAALGGGDG